MSRFDKPLCFLVCMAPLVYCLWQVSLFTQGLANNLGADPGKEIVHYNGKWAMIMMMVTLAVTPVHKVTGLNLIRIRRMLGLFVFFYASLHITAYLVFLLELNISGFVEEVYKRPYIMVGMTAFSGLILLAMTSNRFSQRKLRQNWKRLHRLVYPIAVCIIVHFFWQTRSDFTEPLLYSALLLSLLGYRLIESQRDRLRTFLKDHFQMSGTN